MKKIGISTMCMCDLPPSYLKENGVEVMQVYVHTASGRFRNESEITSENVLEYLASGNVFVKTHVPGPKECMEYFAELLTRYDEVVHITTSDKIGLSYQNAKAGVALMGEAAKRVTLIDSCSISSGMGHLVMMAVALRDSGASVEEIVKECEDRRGKISSTFIVPNAEYLYRVGYVGEFLKDLCSAFKLHPVLCVRNGRLAIKSFRVGSYEKAVARYVRSEFRNSEKILKKQLFITHAGCPPRILSWLKTKVPDLCWFDRITVTKASAVIASCCGPETVGLMFLYE